MKKSFLLSLLILCVVLFIGCKNFMNGSEILNELTDVIEYTNAKEISVRVQLAQGSRGTVFPSGDIKQKLGYKFEISYESDGTCYFNKWTAVDENGQEFDSEFVEIEENEKAKTNVTVKTEQKVIIKANTLDNPSSKVTLSCDFGTGVLSTTQPQEIDIGDNLEIEFTEADNYQFVKWDVSGDCVSVKNIYAKSTKVKSEKDGTVVIKAICAERPAVVSASTKNVTGTVCKNTSTNITFNYPLAADTDLTKIKVYIGDLQTGFGEKKPFLNPQFGNDKKTVIIPANQNSDYYIDVESGTTKQVTVIIPSDFYYVLDDATEEREATKVTVGGEGISWTYEINDKTNENTNITVNPSTALGTLTSGVSGEYSIGKEVVFKYTVNENAQFIKWNVAAADGTVSFKENQDGNVQSLIIKTLKQGDVSIATEVYECPAFIENTILPANVNAGECLDSTFRVTFNQKIDKTAIEDAAIISVDGLALGGKESENKYFTPLFNTDSKTFTFEVSEESSKIIELRELISIDTGKTKTLTVKIPAQAIFYKTNSGEKIIAKNDLNYSYRIKDETTKKANIKYIFTNGTLKIDEASVNTGTAVSYSLGDSVTLYYELQNQYSFQGWTVTSGSNNVSQEIIQVLDSSSQETSLKVLDVLENGVITAKTNERPVITAFEPALLSGGVPEDSQIQMKFSLPIDASTFDYSIKVDGNDKDESGELLFKNSYFTEPVFTDNNKTVTIKVNPKKIINMTGYPVREVSIELKNTVTSENGMTLSQNDLIHTYKINSTKDTTKPRLDSITVTRGIDNKPITDKLPDAWEDADYKSNHVASLHIVCKGTDAGEGLTKIELKQKLLKKVDGQPVNIDLGSVFAEGFNLCSDKTDQYIFDDVVKFNSKVQDGLVETEIILYDGNENFVNAGKWYFIKDTKVDISGVSFESKFASFGNTSWSKDDYDSLNTVFNSWLVRGFSDDIWWNETATLQGGKNFSSLKESLSVKVFWGKEDGILKEKDISEATEYKDWYNNKYKQFILDETDNTFERVIKLVVSDEAGASSEIVKKMPPVISTDEVKIIRPSDQPWDGGFTYSFIFPDYRNEKGESCSYRIFYDMDDCWESDVNVNPDLHKASSMFDFAISKDPVNSDVPKVTKIFISICSPDGVYGNVCSPIDLTEIGEPDSSSLTAPQISAENITITSGGPNSGYFNVAVNIDEEKDIYYSYKIFYIDSRQKRNLLTISSEKAFKFFPSSKSNYHLSVVATDGNVIVESEPLEVTSQFGIYNKPLSIDLIESNVKSFYIDKDYLSTYKFNTEIKDFGSGSHNDKEFTCYYVKYNEDWSGNLNVLTENEIKQLDHFSLKQSFGRSYFTPVIPCNGLPDGDYLMCVYVEDDQEEPNYYLGPVGIEHVDTLPKISDVNYEVKNGIFKVNFKTKEIIKQKYGISYSYTLDENNKWKLIKDGLLYSETGTGKLYLDDDTEECSTVIDNATPNYKKFIKVWSYCFDKDSEYHTTSFFNGNYWSTSSKYTNEAISVPIYVYVNLDSDKKPIPVEDFSYVIDNNSQMTVICTENNPAIVHTLSVSDNFNYGTDVDEWERRGMEYNIKAYTSSGNYIIDDSEVPSKSNYVVVVQFADGSHYISTVRHKD